MKTFNFYPSDNSATVCNISAPVGLAADDFGCVETANGVYVPSVQIDFVSLEPVAGPYTDIFGEYHAA